MPSALAGDGALAQLVERLLCKQDVNGSNPLGSTRPSQTHQEARHDQQALPLAWFARPVGREILGSRLHRSER